MEKFENLVKISTFIIYEPLWNTFHLFSIEKNRDNDILEAIVKVFRKLLILKKSRNELATAQYIDGFNNLLLKGNLEIAFNSAICLSHMSENLNAHKLLYHQGSLKIMAQKLKETKSIHLQNQACRLLANFSCNPQFCMILLDLGVISILTNLLSNHYYHQLIKNCILTLTNLSSFANFLTKNSKMYFLF